MGCCLLQGEGEVLVFGDLKKNQVFELLPERASLVHRKYLAIMETECGFGLGKIPQLEDVSNFLKSIFYYFLPALTYSKY